MLSNIEKLMSYAFAKSFLETDKRLSRIGGGGVALLYFFLGSVKTETKQAQPNFTDHNFIRKLRNGFVYFLGLFTQLRMTKIKIYQLTA